MLKGANAGLGLFLLRIVIGLVFFMHGMGKLVGPPFAGGGMDGTIAFFTQIGIPLPLISAWFVALLETVGGLAVILGVAVPPVALLLAIDMAVAILKVKLSAGFSGGGYEFELTLLAGSLCLVFAGPGIMSVRLQQKS